MTRKYNMDLLRIISAMAIIVIHIVTAPVAHSAVRIDTGIITFLTLTHALMKWAIPVFFMITGYCMLLKEECTYKYCFQHVLKYICVLFTVGLFYSLLEEFFYARDIGISNVAKSVVNVISGNLWDHMWFVYTIIGIYLVMPVIHTFMKQNEESIFILTGLLFLFNIFFPFVQKWILVKADFPFGGYLFYVCFGGVIARSKTITKNVFLCCISGVVSIAWILISNDKDIFGYNHPAICMIAVSIFILFSSIEIAPNKFIRIISECTWGIYLIHPFFINIVIKVLKIDLLSSMVYVKLLIFAIIMFLFSFFATYMLRKIPCIKKLF